MNVVCVHVPRTRIFGDYSSWFRSASKFPNPPKFIVDLPQSVLECGFNAQRCVRSCCEFQSVYTIEFWQCLRRMLCAYMTSDTHLWRLFVVISVVNSQRVSFRIPPKFIVDLPQSVLECAFNAQVRARDFDYFSTDFVRSVFVVYAHDSIWMSATRWMDLHGTSTFSTVGEFPCKTPWFDAMK